MPAWAPSSCLAMGRGFSGPRGLAGNRRYATEGRREVASTGIFQPIPPDQFGSQRPTFGLMRPLTYRIRAELIAESPLGRAATHFCEEEGTRGAVASLTQLRLSQAT